MSKLNFEVQVTDIEPINSSFSRAFCRIAYAGKNRNMSYIEKSVFEEAVHTLYYLPVVGEWKEYNKNYGGHGGRLEVDDDGFREIDTTIPYGCVGSKEDINWRWEKGADGREYFTVDVFLWTRKFPELEIFKKKNSWHSMEVDVIEGGDIVIDGEMLFNIKKMEFTALCILGKDLDNLENNVEPCFETSEIGLYSLNKETFKNGFYELVEELKYSLQNNIDKSEIGKDNAIEINNSKYFTKKSKLIKSKMEIPTSLLKAENYEKLVNETYLVVEGDFESSPSSKLNYPHHVISNGELILDVNGVKKAFAQAKNNGLTGEPIEHLKRHYKTLGLNQDNFESFDLSSEDYYTYFAKKEDSNMAKVAKKIDATVNVETSEVIETKTFEVDAETAETNTPETLEAEAKEEVEMEVKIEIEDETEDETEEDVEMEVETEVKAEAKTTETEETETKEMESEECGCKEKKYSKEEVSEEKSEDKTNVVENTAKVFSEDEYNALKQKFEALTTQHEALKEDYAKSQAKVEKFEKEDKQRVVDSIFAEFSKLLTDEDTSSVKEKAMEMESDELRNSLYAIYGAKVHKFNLSNSENSEVVNMGLNHINPSEVKEDASTDVFEKAKKDLEKK